MVVTMQGLTAVAATTTVPNILAGARYERSPFPGALGALYCCGSAAGLTAELNVAGKSITPPVNVNTQNRYPVVPDDVLVSSWEVLEGKLIQLTVVNPTGGALNFFWRVDLQEADIQYV